ncbi:hypothetical protein GCM10027059_50510 [Myceligenerans halotolerans]
MPRKRFTTPEGIPDIVAVAALALAVMHTVGAERWAEVVSRVRGAAGRIELDQGQVDLLNRHAGALALLRVRPGSTATIAGCPGCGRWQVTTAAVKACRLTPGCGGTLVRATPASPMK